MDPTFGELGTRSFGALSLTSSGTTLELASMTLDELAGASLGALAGSVLRESSGGDASGTEEQVVSSDAPVFKPIRTTSNALNSVDRVDGQFIVSLDYGEVYVDTASDRIRLTDVITGTYSAITSNLAPLSNKLYFATDTHQLLQPTQVDNSLEWVALNGDITVEVTITGSTVSQAIANNTIYNCTGSVTSLTVLADTNLHYATMNLETGTGTITFQMPGSGWVCTGSDCASGIWTPQASVRYCLAFEKVSSALVIVSVYRVGDTRAAISYDDLTDKPTYLTSLMTSTNSGKFLSIDSSGNLVAASLPTYSGTVE